MDLDIEGLLRDLEAQHGILVETAHRTYTFAHLTFQEYYTAKYVSDNPREESFFPLLAHATTDRCREVFFLITGLLPESDLFISPYLQALDGLLQGEEELVKILTWAEEKAKNVDKHYRLVAARAFYLYIARPRDIELALALERQPDLARDPNHLLILLRDRPIILKTKSIILRGLDREPDYNHILDCALSYISDPSLALDLTFAYLYAHINVINYCRSKWYIEADYDALISDLVHDLNLLQACKHARRFALTLGLKNLARALQRCRVPSPYAWREQWFDFLEQLQNIMVEYRSIGCSWTLTDEQDKTLKRYFFATQLFVECLDVVNVTDRQGIEDQLLRPPRY
jgi:hypothetical protein